jgi:hypothetical protein
MGLEKRTCEFRSRIIAALHEGTLNFERPTLNFEFGNRSWKRGPLPLLTSPEKFRFKGRLAGTLAPPS